MVKFCLLLAFLLPFHAHAQSPLLEKLLSDPDPTAFDAAPFAAEDFEVDWQGAPAGASARLLPGSLQWVRVDELLVLPRGLLEVTLTPARPGSVTVSGFTQPLKDGKARILVPLVSGTGNPVLLKAEKLSSIIQLRFKPRAEGERVFFDTSCSRARVAVLENSMPPDSWAYIGCRQVRNQSDDSRRSDLDLLVYADNFGPLVLNGTETTPVDWNRWNVRLTSFSKELELAGSRGKLRLGVSVPEKTHSAFLGAGIGPYAYRFEKGAVKESATVPLATIYSAYTLTQTHRLVFFGAIAAHKHAYADVGAYFQFESLRMFDRRISMNLLVGGHGFSYTVGGTTTYRINVPQGFEFFFYDFLGRGKNASFGGFLQPPINERSYYNTWVRWGPAAWFIEANYISITEPGLYLHTYGLSVGFPLVSFF